MNYYPTLIGQQVSLRPLQKEDSLELVRAVFDGELWNLNYTVVPSFETIPEYVSIALEGRRDKNSIPFVIVDNSNEKVIGTTRFYKIEERNKKLEIGYTFISQSYQKTLVNTEVKLLMLQYAFEELGCNRVQFTTDELNENSRRAILRLGAKEEGILRNHLVMANGRVRNSVIFSIIREEWLSVKSNLLAKLKV